MLAGAVPVEARSTRLSILPRVVASAVSAAARSSGTVRCTLASSARAVSMRCADDLGPIEVPEHRGREGLSKGVFHHRVGVVTLPPLPRLASHR